MEPFELPKYLEKLIATINDGAKSAQLGALAFTAIGLFLLATAFSATDEDLSIRVTVGWGTGGGPKLASTPGPEFNSRAKHLWRGLPFLWRLSVPRMRHSFPARLPPVLRFRHGFSPLRWLIRWRKPARCPCS